MENSIKVSVLGLIKSNNGLFKSDKQKDFLFKKISALDGFIGCNFQIGSTNNSQLFVEFDNTGITKLYKNSQLTWQRIEIGKLNTIQEKNLKKLQKQIKNLQKDYGEKEKSFFECTYSNTVSNLLDYDEFIINNYINGRNRTLKHIQSIEKYILENF